MAPILMGRASTAAITTLERGPANATTAMPERSPVRSNAGFTVTGLAHPKPAVRIIAVPSGSRCANGLRVSLPCRRAVGSPDAVATRRG